MNGIFYNSSDRNPVKMGDRVTLRVFLFWKHIGTVVYVPGNSPKQEDRDSTRYCWICIKYDNGAYDNVDIDASGMLINPKIKFLKRQEAVAFS